MRAAVGLLLILLTGASVSFGFNTAFFGSLLTASVNTPNPFSWVDRNGDAPTSTLITSDYIYPDGFTGSLSISVTGTGSPQISVDGGAWSSSTTITLGDYVVVRLTTASTNSTARSATVTIGSTSSVWTVTTAAAGWCLNPFNSTYAMANGASIIAYQSSFVSCLSGSCTSQMRTCTSGTLSGSYAYQYCSLGAVSFSSYADGAVVNCTAACTTTSSSVWGTNFYTQDSNLCRAAVHAGVISMAGGNVTVYHVGNCSNYTGSTQNGISTSSYSPSWAASRFINQDDCL